jgi:hypothetical protein
VAVRVKRRKEINITTTKVHLHPVHLAIRLTVRDINTANETVVQVVVEKARAVKATERNITRPKNITKQEAVASNRFILIMQSVDNTVVKYKL